MRATIFAALMAAAAVSSGAAAATPGAGSVDFVILWDGSTVTPPDPGLLGSFLGTVRVGDRLGIASLDRETTMTLPLQTFSSGGALSAAYQTASRLRSPDHKGDPIAGIGVAARYLDYQKRPGTTRAVIVVTEMTSKAGRADAGPIEVDQELLSSLLMNEVAVYALTVGRAPGAQLGTMVARSGGKGVSVTADADVIDGLALLYDSLQLRAALLSGERRDGDGGPVDYRYLDEKIDTPDEGVALDKARAAGPAPDGKPSHLVVALLVLVVLLNAAILAMGIARGRAKPVAKQSPGGPGSHRVNESPSFSRLTMGLNRFRGSFNEADSRLEALVLDLEDYGAESWEVEKKLMDEYVSLAQKVFLLIDHTAVAPGSADGGERSSIGRKLTRVLEESGIEVIEAETGDEPDTRYHVQVGTEAAGGLEGTITRVVRRGYVKTDGLVHGEPLVLRKAEVMVAGDDAPSEGGDA